MHHTVRYLAVAILLLSCPLSVAYADELRHLQAASHIAFVITGDIDLSDSQLVFQNKKTFSLSFLGDGLGMNALDTSWEARQEHEWAGKLYRIVNPANVTLLWGNTLCGTAVPTYLTVYERVRSSKDNQPSSYYYELNMVFLTFFEGETKLTPSNYQNRVCGGFAYEIPS